MEKKQTKSSRHWKTNGRLGAMVFGGVSKDHLQLNEESLWAGLPVDVYPDNFSEHLATLQRLILDGNAHKASEYGRRHMTPVADVVPIV